MIEAAALAIVLLGAGWLGFVGLVCIAAPGRARSGLARMGSTWAIQLGEHLPRALVGAAMVLRAPASKAPQVFEIAGWFILASSILILLLPMRWHNAYAAWWAARIPLGAYRVLALPTLAAAGLLAWAAF